MLEFIIAIILGIGVGIFTGLSPGIHINLISVILLSFYSSFSEINPFFLVIFIVSMAIAHTFMDFIPSVFLGAPDENSFLSILPGHQLFRSEINPFFLVIFIVSMAIAHTFMDFIPSVFLGAPDENSFLSILPGHQLLLQGKG